MTMPVQVCDEFQKFESATRSLQFNHLAAALAAFQDEVPAPEKNKFNSHLKSKYADLSSVITTIRPYLHKNGLVYAQPLDYEKDQVIVYTEIFHTPSGQWLRSRLGLSLKDTNPQTAGIVISYARRYSLLATLAMPHDDEDNDGEVAAEKKKDPKYQNISVSEPKPTEPPKKPAPAAKPETQHDTAVKQAEKLFDGKVVSDTRKPADEAPLAAEAKDDLWDLCLRMWPHETKVCLTEALKNRKLKPVDFRTLTVGQGRVVFEIVSELLGNDGSQAPF